MSTPMIAVIASLGLLGAPIVVHAEPELVPATTTTPAPEAAPAPTADPAPAPVEPAPTTVAPTPVEPTPTPVAVAPAAAAPSDGEAAPVDPRPARMAEVQRDPLLSLQYRRAENMVVTGAVGVGLGLATLLLVTLPAEALYNRSVSQIEDAEWVTDTERPRARANTRYNVMVYSGAVGGAVALTGGVLLIVGLTRRAQLRRTPPSTFALAPVVGGGQLGLGASLRF